MDEAFEKLIKQTYEKAKQMKSSRGGGNAVNMSGKGKKDGGCC